jgi:beta-alanine--pyruvate transaminase
VGFGGISVGGMGGNRKTFNGQLLPAVDHMPHTHNLEKNAYSRGQPQWGAEVADGLEGLVALHDASNIAAVIVEPVAGSTGVLIPPKGYLQKLRQICDKHGILLIFDEVITGFGRTGQAFAAQSFGVTPDLITMAKALTNAAQPMGAVAISERIHDTIFAAAPEDAIEFFHGYTYSGHPAACAAGLATLDIYKSEGLFERGRALSPYFLDAMFSLKDVDVLADIRGYGMLAAIELKSDGVPGRRGHVFQKKLFDNGLNLKTTGDSAIIAPPLIAEKAHVDTIVEILRTTLATV